MRIGNASATAVLTGHTNWAEYCAFSPDGNLLASAGNDRLIKIWVRDKNGERPFARASQPGVDGDGRYLFHEYFHADSGKGLGASHQTGWTAL